MAKKTSASKGKKLAKKASAAKAALDKEKIKAIKELDLTPDDVAALMKKTSKKKAAKKRSKK